MTTLTVCYEKLKPAQKDYLLAIMKRKYPHIHAGTLPFASVTETIKQVIMAADNDKKAFTRRLLVLLNQHVQHTFCENEITQEVYLSSAKLKKFYKWSFSRQFFITGGTLNASARAMLNYLGNQKWRVTASPADMPKMLEFLNGFHA